MKKLLNKKLIIYVLVVSIIMILLDSLVVEYYYNKYDNELKIKMDSIITLIIDKYPDIKEEEIINILSSKENGNILAKYGIDNHIILKNRDYLKQNITIIVISNIIIIILILLIYLNHIQKENKKIKQITNYISRINNHNYALELNEFDEEELSKLQDELYKVTIMLKEQALNSSLDKQKLKIALEDISHQLKTPLTSISIMIDNILDNPSMDEKIKNSFLIDINKQIEKINFLVITLLKLSRFDTNNVIMKKDNICIKDLINKVRDNLNILLEIKNIKIELIDNDISFIGDLKWEEEAITNIIKNCIEHSKDNSKITITTFKTPFYTEIVITDEGEGINEVDTKNIFKRFYKGENSTDDSFGIGLNLAHTIIEKDNGFIKVKSKLKKGTSFYIKYMKNEI